MKKAFTLIELLIVIAIIAILALIAVPNFLEAQVRAKVSRVYADMRTVGVAIEAYSVDWGRPPVDTDEGQTINLSPRHPQSRMIPLTTPVAYLTGWIRDPFAMKGFTTGSSF